MRVVAGPTLRPVGRVDGLGEPTRGAVRVDVPGSHVTMLHGPHVAALATRLGEAMSR